MVFCGKNVFFSTLVLLVWRSGCVMQNKRAAYIRNDFQKASVGKPCLLSTFFQWQSGNSHNMSVFFIIIIIFIIINIFFYFHSTSSLQKKNRMYMCTVMLCIVKRHTMEGKKEKKIAYGK